MIKMVLALQHRMLPRSLHITEPSHEVDWDAGAVRLLTEPSPWPSHGRPRRAGVSSFGISGTNAHFILEEAPSEEAPSAEIPAGGAAANPPEPEDRPVLQADALPWLVSARTPGGLRAQASQLLAFAGDHPELNLADIGFSLATSRPVFRYRAAAAAADRAELRAGLAALAAGQPGATVAAGLAAETGKTVFVFSGQGTQWTGMGRELAACSPVFAARLAECGQALSPYVDWDLQEVIADTADRPKLRTAEMIQPVLWAVMVSLAALWRAAGVRPDAVVGHSQGEIAAACAAGILSLEDAARVVAVRSRALSGLGAQGAMVSVVMPAAGVRELLARWGGRLSVAAVNAPAATVVSGDPAALTEFEAELAARHVMRWRIPATDFVAHSARVEELAGVLTAELASIRPAAGLVPMFSTALGRWVGGPELDAGYWYANVRETVGFAGAVTALADAGHRTFIEVSPHPVLTTAVEATLEEHGTAAAAIIGTLRRDDGGAERMLSSLAEAWVNGAPVDWTVVARARQRVELPTYPFQRQRYWPERQAAPARDLAAAGLTAAGHPLLGAAVDVAQGNELLFTGQLSLQTHPWLADHAVAGVVVLPGAVMLELAAVAAYRAASGQVEELILESPLVLPPDDAVRVQVAVGGPDAAGRRPVAVFARPPAADGPWTRHASGWLAPASGPGPDHDELTVWPPAGARPLPAAGLYEGLAASGYGYGPAFRGLRAAWQRGADTFAEVALPEELAADAAAFGLHPALLDAALHALGLAAEAGSDDTAAPKPQAGESRLRLPFAWREVSLYAAGAAALRVRLRPDGHDGVSVAAADAGTGAPVLSVGSLTLRPVSSGQLALFGVEWVPVPAAAPAAGFAGRCAVIGDDPLNLGSALGAADVRVHQDLAGLAAAVAAGELVPEVVLACTEDGTGTGAEAARAASGRILGLVQRWLADERLAAARLVVLTRGAVAAEPGESLADLPAAAAWGLLRTVQSENPGRLVLVDLPPSDQVAGDQTGPADLAGAVAAALSSGEPEVAVRAGSVYARRLGRPVSGLGRPATGQPWRLEGTGRNEPDLLALVPRPALGAPLSAGQVRVAVRAAALDATDARLAGDSAALGRSVAGVVMETGPGVTGLAAGDRVLGLVSGAAGPVAVTDERLLAPLPPAGSFAAAAAGLLDQAATDTAAGAAVTPPPPLRAWDVRRAPEALRYLSENPAAGTVVLTIPPDPAAPRRPGTALIVGGTGTLGGLLARHLADAGTADGVLLASRSGPGAPGVAAQAADLAGRGTEVRVAACDAADRPALAALLDSISGARPLTAVVHAAGVIDDGVTGALTPARLDAVMRPKADVAWHLHELTQGADLETFVLFSSAAATFGAAGQGNYVAANAFLDALAGHRRSAGLPAVSLAWGTWVQKAGIGRNLGEAQLARFSNSAMVELAADEGLALLDLALGRDEAVLVPTRLSLPMLRGAARAGLLPALLRDLVPVPRDRPTAGADAPAGAALRERLSRAAPAEQQRLLLDQVRTEVSAVLGYASPESVETELTFLEQGLDSLTAVEFRNRLSAVTGVRLAGSAAFDYPTPALLAQEVRARLAAEESAGGAAGQRQRDEDSGGHRYVAAASAGSTGDAGPAAGLSALYLRAAQSGQAAEIMRLMRSLAAFRPSFSTPAELSQLPRPLALASGAGGPRVMCFPSFSGRSPAQEYARFAAGFAGTRAVGVIPAPGFIGGEPLAASVDALVLAHADNLARGTAGPLVLAGHSSGGLVAHALATHLERAGTPPAAIVLMDAYPAQRAEFSEGYWSMLPSTVLADRAQAGDLPDDAWLTAVAHYFSLDWAALAETAVPTLLVRAREPVSEHGAEGDWQNLSWPYARHLTVLDVPGDHFTMMGEHAGTTAAAVNEWLSGL
jgi:acyl transferase domain-containing protein/thioesterase domain-containing protein/acyl carrier protein